MLIVRVSQYVETALLSDSVNFLGHYQFFETFLGFNMSFRVSRNTVFVGCVVQSYTTLLGESHKLDCFFPYRGVPFYKLDCFFRTGECPCFFRTGECPSVSKLKVCQF